jgi:hypothetical protein
LDGVTLTGWYVGYVIAAVVIILVVALVAIILSLVRRIGQQAAAVVDVLDDVRKNTTSIPAVATLNQGLLSVVEKAATARKALGG